MHVGEGARAMLPPLEVCVCRRMCPLAGMSADVPSNPAVGLLWISSRLQGMGIPFPFTALPGRRRGTDASSLLPSHRLEAEGARCREYCIAGVVLLDLITLHDNV